MLLLLDRWGRGGVQPERLSSWRLLSTCWRAVVRRP